ncbi:hypothetical protein [Streptomyces achromogenes]
MNRHLTPRLASALFRRYLRSCIPSGPHRLAGARTRAAPGDSRPTGRP